MGGMVAIAFAGKYPERTTSVVINCAAAKLGVMGKLIFKNWIDIARTDPDGPGSRLLAELITWQGALQDASSRHRTRSRSSDHIQTILRDSNTTRGVHGRLPGDVRHGPDAVAAEDHRRRRS